MKFKEKGITIFAYALLLVSFATNIAANCCVVSQVGEPTSTSDSVPGGLALSSQGCLSILQTNGNIATYPVNQATCALESVLPLTSFTVSGTSGLTYSPDGSCLAAFNKSGIQTFSASSNCALSTTGSFNAQSINSVAISSLNCIAAGSCLVSSLAAPLTSCTVGLTSALNVSELVYSADGTCLAAIDCSTPTNILTFGINYDCSVSAPLSTSQFANAVDLAFSPNGSCLVVLSGTSASSSVSSFSVSNCQISSTPQSSASSPVGVQPTQISFSSDGTCIAVANTNGYLDIYSIDSSCNLTYLTSFLPSSEETGRSVGWLPNANCLYFVTNANIYTFSRMAPPVVAISTFSTCFCAGKSVTLTAITTASEPTFVWSNGSTGNPITVNTPGSYFVTVTDGVTGCSAISSPVFLTEFPAPTASISASSTSFCSGYGVTLTAVTNACQPTFSWSNGATGNPITVTTPGSYSVTVTDGVTGCSTTSQPVVITENPLPTVSITASSKAFCAGYSVTLTATTDASEPLFSWSNGATGNPITVTTPGSYFVTVTDGVTGCSNTSNTIVVFENCSPNVSVTPISANLCEGESVVLTAMTNAASPTYQWFDASGAIPGAIDSTFAVTSAGTYYVVVTDGRTGCQGVSNSVTITANNSILALFQCCDNTASCDGVKTFEVSVQNLGPCPATGFTVTEKLPCCFSFQCGKGKGWTIEREGKRTVKATYNKQLAANETASFTLQTRANCCCPEKKNVPVSATLEGGVPSATRTACCVVKLTEAS